MDRDVASIIIIKRVGCPEECRGRLSLAGLQQGLLASRRAHPLLPPRALESRMEFQREVSGASRLVLSFLSCFYLLFGADPP